MKVSKPIKELTREDVEAMSITSETVLKEPYYTPYDRVKKAITIGKWEVGLDGTLDYNNGRYVIEPTQLEDDDWILHLNKKAWIDWKEFLPAYFQALKNIGVQEIKMKVFY